MMFFDYKKHSPSFDYDKFVEGQKAFQKNRELGPDDMPLPPLKALTEPPCFSAILAYQGLEDDPAWIASSNPASWLGEYDDPLGLWSSQQSSFKFPTAAKIWPKPATPEAALLSATALLTVIVQHALNATSAAWNSALVDSLGTTGGPRIWQDPASPYKPDWADNDDIVQYKRFSHYKFIVDKKNLSDLCSECSDSVECLPVPSVVDEPIVFHQIGNYNPNVFCSATIQVNLAVVCRDTVGNVVADSLKLFPVQIATLAYKDDDKQFFLRLAALYRWWSYALTAPWMAEGDPRHVTLRKFCKKLLQADSEAHPFAPVECTPKLGQCQGYEPPQEDPYGWTSCADIDVPTFNTQAEYAEFAFQILKYILNSQDYMQNEKQKQSWNPGEDYTKDNARVSITNVQTTADVDFWFSLYVLDDSVWDKKVNLEAHILNSAGVSCAAKYKNVIKTYLSSAGPFKKTFAIEEWIEQNIAARTLLLTEEHIQKLGNS